MGLLFEWDNDKAKKNLEKHAVSFEEAATVFEDSWSITILDPIHSLVEDRFVILGHSHKHRLLVVAHTERGDHIQIISVRRSTKKEREDHEKNS